MILKSECVYFVSDYCALAESSRCGGLPCEDAEDRTSAIAHSRRLVAMMQAGNMEETNDKENT
jgi:hypothetical protein